MKTARIDITVIVEHETDEAVLVDYGGGGPVWLPLSQIDIRPSEDGKTHTVTLPEWLAIEKKMI